MSTTLVKDKSCELTGNAQKAQEHFREKLAFEITPYELSKHLDNSEFQIVDVRAREEYSEFHIRGAISIPLSQLEERLSELSREKITVVYCTDLYCRASTRAALMLAEHGYPVKELEGGFKAWNQKALPLQR